ncbi:MAG: hypothetical protein H6R19_1404 [Proteobacteria bacterium]|nr:hypothetical protein [Pseudomonadota bacterium]
MRLEIIPNMFADTARPSTPPRMRKLQSAMPIAMVCLGNLFLTSPALAIGLGNATTNSRIGAPLRVEIPMQSDDPDRIELGCIHLVGAPPGYSDDIPWLTNGSLSFGQGSQGRILIITARPSNHPAIMLGLRVECGVGLRRDYALLLNPPSSAEASALPTSSVLPSTKPVPTEPVHQTATTASTNAWQVQAGDSARNIANRLIPGNREAQRKFAHAILAQNADKLGGTTATLNTLPVGVTLTLPALPAPSPTHAVDVERVTPRDQTRSPSPDTPSPVPPRAKPAKSGVSRDRLLVTEGGSTESSLRMATTIGQRKELGEEQRARLRTEMQLIATLDDKIATQIELSERLRQLEAMQESLKQDAARLEGELQAARAQQSSIPASSAPLAIHTQPPAAAHPSPAEKPESQSSWYTSNTFILGALLLIATGLGAALWMSRRRQSVPKDGNSLVPDQVSGETGDVADHLIEPLSEADIWPDEEGRAPKAATLRSMNLVEGALGHFTASGLGPPSLLQIVDDNVEEHDSAVELAEIMMSFGRVHGAAQTLADFIRSNPKQAVKPWIKLLEVYRVANMRAEFDALSTQLNKTFNVKTVEWDNFELLRQAPESLEDMPHILTKLTELWGKRECQAYLHSLLRDNRQGTRQGFPLAIVDEILMLLGVLEGQLGAYRPDTTDSLNAGLHTAATATLNIPPIVPTVAPATSPQTVSPQPAVPVPAKQIETPPPIAAPAVAATVAKPAPAAAPELVPKNLQQLDFELDMTDLSKTLHLNLDDLDEDGSFMKDTDSI